MSIKPFTISGRVYRKNPDVNRYQIPFTELDDLRMDQIPPHSHVEILGLPEPEGVLEMECYGVNGGDENNNEYLTVYGGATFKVDTDAASLRMIARLRRVFPQMDPVGRGMIKIPNISTEIVNDGFLVHIFISINFEERPLTLVKDAVVPFVDGYTRLNRPDTRIFICHASEDKPIARDLAVAMKRLGSEVWFDEWEIRVGDSIVQKINAALGTVTHLIVMLSKQSVNKPWVQKELSSALMYQLSRNSIIVLPLLLDDCTIPAILADVKYADARNGIDSAVNEIQHALFPDENADMSL